MKHALVTGFAVLAATLAAAETHVSVPVPAASPSRGSLLAPVDLGRPGALDRLEASNPEHYRKAANVLEAAASLPCTTDALRLLQARDEVRDVNCGFLLLTSFPPKRRIGFRIDEVHYTSVVTMTYDPGRIVRLNEPR